MSASLYSREARLPLGVAAVVLALTTVVYVTSGTPVPRPWYFFGGVAAALGALLFAVLRAETLTRPDVFAIGGLATLAGGVLRFSAFITVITSGIDHTRWVRRVQSNIAANGITGTDMYASAPFYLLELGMGQRLFGLAAFETRFITLAIASLFPVVLGTFAYYLTEDVQTGLVAVLVGTPQFLFLRTSALLEAESLALLWYALTMLLLVRYLQTRDMRLFALFSGFLLTAVFLHFLYAVILFCTVVGTLGLLALVEWGTPLKTPVSYETGYRLAQGTGAAGLFIPVWILTSTYGRVAVDVIQSFFSRDTNDEPETATDTPTETATPSDTPTGTPETPTGTPDTPTRTEPNLPTEPQSGPSGQEGGSSLLDGIADFIIPQSGTVAQSVSASSGDALVALLPLALFFGGGLGGLVAVVRRRAYDLLLLALLLTVGLMAVVGVFLDIQFRLGYRIYYFVGVLLVVATAIGISRSPPASRHLLAALLVVSVFLPYAAIGPMSPLGNNVDSQFGGTDWRFTQSEYDQLTALDNQFNHGETVQSDVPQVPNGVDIETNETGFTLKQGDCTGFDGKIAETGAFSICT